MEEYQFGEAGRQIFEFFWSEYCDWYVEIAKLQLQDERQRERTAAILRAVLDTSLRLLHPFMPFVTEEIWQHLYADVPEGVRPAPALIIAAWPGRSTSPAAFPTRGERGATSGETDETAEADFALVQQIVTGIRDAVKTENDRRSKADIERLKRVPVILVGGEKAALLEQQAPLIQQLARTEPLRIELALAAKPEQAMALVAGSVEIYLPLAGMLDVEKERARLDTEIAEAQAQIARSRTMLDNPNFVGRARPDVVQRERDVLSAAEDTLARLEAHRRELGA
jgi:valyl-tRNA synthetase